MTGGPTVPDGRTARRGLRQRLRWLLPERFAGTTQLGIDEVHRRWRKRHRSFESPMRARQRGTRLKLRGTVRSLGPDYTAAVVRIQVHVGASGSDFSGWVRPSPSTLFLMAIHAAFTVGGWFVLAFNSDYRDLGGLLGVSGISVISGALLRCEVRDVVENRRVILDRARGALGVRSLRPRASGADG